MPTMKTNALDRLGMSELLRNFSKQIEEALEIGENFDGAKSLTGPFEKICFIGMGGSAIGGDVIRSLFAQTSPVPVWVSRHYDLPPFVDSKTLCIFSSYSGNTEETISAFHQAMQRELKGVIITSGGELSRLSKSHHLPWIQIPTGFPPRAALGYSVFPVLKLLSKIGLWEWEEDAVEETLSLLKNLAAKRYAPEVALNSNPAKKLAKKLHKRFAAIYAGVELLEVAALRFRNQIEENAKALASHHIIPEMNHNEILGWQFPKELVSKCAAVFLRDEGDHPRIQLRMKITQNVVAKSGAPRIEIYSQGRSRLARLFSVIYLGDWISYYLALLYKIDPTPVVVIESLKKQLAGA